MKKFLLLLIPIMGFMVACHDKQIPSVSTNCSTCVTCKEGDGINSPQCVWRQNSSSALAKTVIPIFYKDILVMTKGVSGETEVIQFFNKNTGEKLAEWSDYEFGAPKLIGSDKGMYINDGILVVCTGTRLYGIDLTTFKTIWKSRSSNNLADGNMYGAYDKTYHASFGATEFVMTVYEGLVKTGKYRPLITFQVPDTTKLDLVFTNAFVKGTDTFALICTNNYFYNSNQFKGYFTLLNVSKNTKVYEKEINPDIIDKRIGGIIGPAVIKDDIMFYGGLDAIYAFELMTGKLKWRTPLAKHSTCPIVMGKTNGVDYLFNSTVDGFIRCNNLSDGVELWKTAVPPSIAPLAYHDEHLYFRGASSNLKVLDTRTKKIIWDYELSENKKDKSRFVNTYVIPDPATGKIYTTDYIDVYCFNPVKK